ncbi:hypothetical protein [Cellulomonas sp. KRMCY2]|uniref:hypothetical protein n=1 Tax=Cellulomonas sp. KRMCY2 TaxID=1304865 RepID=UPI00045EB1CA|nr:hypothetical protein [Cellulomonas sp. KRMCY2]
MNVAHAGVSEFDRFGPWIDEVHVPEDVPRLFRAYPIDLGAARVVLKVPRNIARRDATADMDLYDHLLVLEQDQLTVLSRHAVTATRGVRSADGPGYDVLTVPLVDVVAIHDVVNLLDGRLTVATSAGASVTVRYNGAARAKVNRLVDELRAGAGARPSSPVSSALLAAARPPADVTASPDAGPADKLLVSDFLEVRRGNPDLIAWACHGRRPLAPSGEGLQGSVRRALHALSPMTLHGAVVSADAVALEVFGRHAWLVRGSVPVNSSSRLVIPLGAPDRLDVVPNPVYPGATMVTIRAGAWATELAVPNDSVAQLLLSAAAEICRT